MSDVPETHVPADESPARCPHCNRPFRTSQRRDLHLGRDHEDALDEGERGDYEAALEVERDALFGYQLRVVIALGVTYAMMVIVLMVLLG